MDTLRKRHSSTHLSFFLILLFFVNSTMFHTQLYHILYSMICAELSQKQKKIETNKHYSSFLFFFNFPFCIEFLLHNFRDIHKLINFLLTQVGILSIINTQMRYNLIFFLYSFLFSYTQHQVILNRKCFLSFEDKIRIHV